MEEAPIRGLILKIIVLFLTVINMLRDHRKNSNLDGIQSVRMLLILGKNITKIYLKIRTKYYLINTEKLLMMPGMLRKRGLQTLISLLMNSIRVLILKIFGT